MFFFFFVFCLFGVEYSMAGRRIGMTWIDMSGRIRGPAFIYIWNLNANGCLAIHDELIVINDSDLETFLS